MEWIKNLKEKIWKFMVGFLLNDDAGSTLETGLIWALIIVLFLLLVGWIMDLYTWIETKFEEIFSVAL